MVDQLIRSLDACPWCGTAEHLSLSSRGSLTSDMPDRPYHVCCHHIDHDIIEGPVAYGKSAAIAAWNKRHTPAPQSITPPEPLRGNTICQKCATRHPSYLPCITPPEVGGWDHRFRRLEEGELIEESDEHMLDDGSWELTNCAGQKAPDPNYTSHRWYRRLKVVPEVEGTTTCQSISGGRSASSTSIDARPADTKAGPEVGGELVERVARAIDPNRWSLRDADAGRRVEWDAGIKAGWGATTFEEWVERWVPESIETARRVIAALSTPEVVDGPSGVWSKAVYAAADKARNDALAIDPNDQMSALAVAVDAALACEASDAKGLVEALEKIERWFGEFPETGRFWDEPESNEPMSYSACFGSNGERDFMREIARTALSQHRGVS